MIGAQNDDNTRNMPQCPHFHFGIYPCLYQTFISKDLTHPLKLFCPEAQAPDAYLDSDLGGLLLLQSTAVPCSSYEITSDLLI